MHEDLQTPPQTVRHGGDTCVVMCRRKVRGFLIEVIRAANSTQSLLTNCSIPLIVKWSKFSHFLENLIKVRWKHYLNVLRYERIPGF